MRHVKTQYQWLFLLFVHLDFRRLWIAKWSLNTRIDSNSNSNGFYGNIFIELATLAIKIRPVILTEEYLFAHGANSTITSFEKASCIVMSFQLKINPEFNKKSPRVVLSLTYVICTRWNNNSPHWLTHIVFMACCEKLVLHRFLFLPLTTCRRSPNNLIHNVLKSLRSGSFELFLHSKSVAEFPHSHFMSQQHIYFLSFFFDFPY